MPQPSPRPDEAQRRLLFRLGGQNHEIDAAGVIEVIRVSHITRVPGAPALLVGITNLRGRALPVVSMDRIVNGEARPLASDGKIIVYDHNGGVGLLVDDVLRLSGDSQGALFSAGTLAERLDTAFTFSRRPASRKSVQQVSEAKTVGAASLKTFLSFRVSGQLYGLPLDCIREVATLSGNVALIPNAAEDVLGLVTLRDTALPLIALSPLLGLDRGPSDRDRTDFIVISHQGALVGLAVDAIEAIRRLLPQALDTVPAVLQHGRGDAQIEAIARLPEGGTLMSVLSPDKLWGHQTVSQALDQNLDQRLDQNNGTHAMDAAAQSTEQVEQFLIFRLGDERYGLPIAAVDEVIRVPADITRVPGAPAFVTGIINLRGQAVPLIDQRVRFEAPATDKAVAPRAIVLTLGALRAGFVVDEVSEVTSIRSDTLSDTPDFSAQDADVFDRVAHVEADGRMLLLIDPQALLSKAERDAMAEIADNKRVADAP